MLGVDVSRQLWAQWTPLPFRSQWQPTDCRVPPSLALGTVCLEEHVGMLKWLTGTQDLPVGVKFSRH